MAVSHYVGKVTEDTEDYFWGADVVHLKGKRTPQQQLAHCLKSFLNGEVTVSQTKDAIWLHAENGLWLQIDEKGRFEFGEAGA